MFPLLSSIHASVLYFNHRMVVLSSSPCYRFWLVPLHSLTQRRPLWNDGLSPSLPAAATSSLLCPYLTSQASSPVSLLLFPMWTERLDQSKSELQPAKKPQCLPLPSPASLLTCSSAQIFQQLRCSKLLETSKRTQNLKQKDRASSLCQITMCNVMLGKSEVFLGWSCVPIYNWYLGTYSKV